MGYPHWFQLLLGLACLLSPACGFRGTETLIGIHSLAGTLRSPALPSKACVWVASLPPAQPVVFVLVAHDAATLADCAALTPPPLFLPPAPPHR